MIFSTIHRAMILIYPQIDKLKNLTSGLNARFCENLRIRHITVLHLKDKSGCFNIFSYF